MENYSVLINTIPHQLKIVIRSLERCVKKVNNANWSIVFNETCIKEKILQKYSKGKKFLVLPFWMFYLLMPIDKERELVILSFFILLIHVLYDKKWQIKLINQLIILNLMNKFYIK